MRSTALALLTLTACGADGTDVTGADAADPGYRVIASYRHDASAFTQGLELDGDTLLEGTGLRGRSSLRRVTIATGGIITLVPLANPYFGEGLTRFGDTIFQLTWQEQTGFRYAADTLAATGTFSYEGEGWGLTHDSTSLIMSNGSNILAFRDPTTFDVQRRLTVLDGDVPINQLNELEWVRGEVWANVWRDNRIARIDPETGVVKAWLDLTALVPAGLADSEDAVLNGIAYDAARDRIYVTGKLWPVLYELETTTP